VTNHNIQVYKTFIITRSFVSVTEALLGRGWRVAPRVAESKMRQSEYFKCKNMIFCGQNFEIVEPNTRNLNKNLCFFKVHNSPSGASF
jgi:hypothetical protein